MGNQVTKSDWVIIGIMIIGAMSILVVAFFEITSRYRG
jgi:hypothetical protein